MAQAGWLQTNEGRAYPLVDPPPPAGPPALVRRSDGATVALPEPTLADLALALVDADGLGAGLASVARSADGATVTFAFAVGAASTLDFAAAADAPEFADVAATLDADGACSTFAAASGTLTLGQLGPLLALLGPGDALVAAAPLAVEPSTVCQVSGLPVLSINLANLDRTRVPAPGSSPPAVRPVVVGATCLAGPLVVRPGYNATVRQVARTNTLVLGAAPGAGDGPACDEVPLTENEVPPPGSRFLDGSPACNDFVTSVAGISGPDVPLSGGGAIAIYPDPHAPATLVVQYNPTEPAGCPPVFDSSLGSESSFPSSGDSVYASDEFLGA